MKNRKILSLLLKTVILLASTVGILLCLADASAFMGGATLLLYFTIQSNVWIGLTAAVGIALTFLRGGKYAGHPFCQTVKFVFTVAIALTGLVYCTMLAPTLSGAWKLSQLLVHVVTPIASILDFLLCDSKYLFTISWKKCFFSLIPPAYYVAFAAVGYIAGWNFGGGNNYPYFFLNWGTEAGAFGFSSDLPFLGTAYWILLLGAVVYFVGLLLSKGYNRGKREE